ncbi:MAG TPA: LacI family transcriptional regulator [Firmicutes bacterium]|nr:LacI family transcriptional regulator [Bacillota bacterium]
MTELLGKAKGPQKINQKQIAAMLNISQSTVSRALSGSRSVDTATRRKVLEAAKALGYTPNYLAQSLVLQRTRHLCYIMPTFGFIQGEVTSSILAGAGDTAGELGYRFTLVAEAQEELLTLAADGMYDGLFLTLEDPESALEQLNQILEANYPIVLVNCWLDDPRVHYVATDNWYGAYTATRYLQELGHRRIAFVGPLGGQIGKERFLGFKTAFQEASPGLDPQTLDVYWPKRIEEVEKRLEEVFNFSPFPTAFVVSSDLTAIGLMRLLEKRGSGVPQDVSVIGFDDITTAAYNLPALTTVEIPGHRMGCEAMHVMYRLLNRKASSKPEQAIQIKVPARLIKRDSCEAPACSGS